MNASRVTELQNHAHQVQTRIALACEQTGRQVEDVRLIWVSKTKPLEDVEAACVAGARDFGENKVQEGLEKFSVSRPGVELHLIGPVQSNKLRKAAGIAQWIHSISDLRALQKLNQVCQELDKDLKILFQINTSQEFSKSGLSMENAKDFLMGLPALERLHYRGLMTIGVHSGEPEDSRAGFAWLRELRDHLSATGHAPFQNFTELSMGMTDDLEVAIAEGATMIRVGTALFGQRQSTGNPL